MRGTPGTVQTVLTLNVEPDPVVRSWLEWRQTKTPRVEFGSYSGLSLIDLRMPGFKLDGVFRVDKGFTATRSSDIII